MSAQPLNFEPITNEERSVLSSEAQYDILALFETAMNASTKSDIDQKANRFVTDLVTFEAKSEIKPALMAEETWQVILNAASCTPSRHYGQDVLVRIFHLLGTAGDTWKDYPGIGISVRDEWNRSPVFQIHEDDDSFSLDEWLNVNSFVARLGRGFTSFGLWELRVGLEGLDPQDDENPTYQAVVNTRILVAAEWILQAGRELLRSSLLNALSEKPGPTSGKPWDGGPLFPGTRGFNLERWGFWKRRLGELRKDAVDSTQKIIDEAIERMTALEAELANALNG